MKKRETVYSEVAQVIRGAEGLKAARTIIAMFARWVGDGTIKVDPITIEVGGMPVVCTAGEYIELARRGIEHAVAANWKNRG